MLHLKIQLVGLSPRSNTICKTRSLSRSYGNVDVMHMGPTIIITRLKFPAITPNKGILFDQAVRWIQEVYNYVYILG